MKKKGSKGFGPETIFRLVGFAFFAYLFFGFMLLPCLNTLTSIFTTKNAAGEIDPWAVVRFFFAGNMSKYVWNSLKLAVLLVITVNVVGVSIVLLTEYFDIKGAKILRLGYMTTLIYSGVALVTGYLFLYDRNGIITSALVNAFPGINPNWFSGFNAVLFTMTFACTSNHVLFLRNAIRGIDYNTVEAARNMGAKPFAVLWKVVFPTLIPTMFSLTVMTFITGLCAMSAPTLLGYDSINPEIVRLAGSSIADEAFPQARAALLSIILAMFTIVLFSVWKNMGYYMVIYLAGLQGINAELYEAASLDGANSLQRFRYITWPQLQPTTFFVTIILTINCFKVYDIVYMLAGGSNGVVSTSAMVLVYHIYEEAFRNWNLGYASAVAMVLFLMVLVITLIQFRGEKKYAN